MRFLLPLSFLVLAACPDSPDDSCLEEGSATVNVTLEADRDDITTSDLDVRLADCLDSWGEGTGAVGDTVAIEAPSIGELAVTVTGTWANDAGDTGTCTGEATVDPEEGVDAEVTVSLTCVTDA